MKLDKEGLIDISLSVVGGLRPSDRFIDRALALAGGVIGGVATGAFLVSRWLRTQHHGATPQEEGK